MILLVDAGNTRVKWGCMEAGLIDYRHEWVHKGQELSQLVVMLDSLPARPDRMLVCNVAGFDMARTLSQYAEDRLGVRPEFIQVERERFGLKLGYTDPRQLGVDRWVAMIGATAEFHTPLCVVDAGTALTIDGVDATGQHLGGVIAAGVALAEQSLNLRTSDIAGKREGSDEELTLFMDNTDGAVRAGALFSIVALVEKYVTEMSHRIERRPQVLVTGGDGERVRDKLSIPAQWVPDLVLRGLRAFAKREP